jgi:aminopeptidase N
MRDGRRRLAAGLLGLLVLVAGCTAETTSSAPSSSSPPPSRSSPPPSPAEPAAPTTPPPWSERPVVELRFEPAEDLGSVTGWERIEFTPDLPTCEVVLRAWPNKPATALAGSSLVVTGVRVDARAVEVVDVPAGAPEEAPAGTLLEVPLVDCLDAGEQVTVEVNFEVTLGEDVNERVGTSTEVDAAWFGTAFPLLAWERGRGWDRGPAVPVTGEMAVSEVFRLASLEVVADDDHDVLAVGEFQGTAPAVEEGRTVHRFTADAVRDVTVTVGDLDVLEREVAGVRVHLAADREADADLQAWLTQIEESIRSLEELLGDLPYDDLWVSVLSSESSGIEFPMAVQFGDVDPRERQGLVTHELAHMWFYAMVGNDQGEDPWLDESFATFAQLVADGQGVRGSAAGLVGPRDGEPRVGGSMAYWAEFRRASSTYFDTVYTLGGAALVEARDRAGHRAFDAALRRYLSANAWSIAMPDDVQEAFAELPEVLTVLRDVGALP